MTTTPTTSASSAPPTPNQPRIAGAPISWGVCEVPDWGYQLAPSRVLDEMRDIGLAATELGPEGFLPTDPDQMARALAAHKLTAVGGFTPVVMHRPGHDPLPAIDRILDQYKATHAEVLVLSATSGLDGYDTRPTLDEDGWKLLLRNLDRISDRAAERGVRAVLHPHVGTMVENGDEVQRVLGGSSISLCLDTGHLLIGGTDPADLTRQAPERIAHTHLKDVDSQIADKVRAGRLNYTEAVSEGMYRPLGTGDVDVESIVNTLQGNGYTGWYTLEQDTILTEEPRGEGPATDVRISADHVRTLLTAPAAADRSHHPLTGSDLKTAVSSDPSQ
jgi:inosose dehydratase